MVLFFGAVADSDVRGRPLRLVAVPVRRERADCRRAISASMAINISEVVIAPLYQQLKVIAVLLKRYALVGWLSSTA
jgi:hypothetical protein